MLENIEKKLRRALEEIEERKRRLKELEEEERKLLKELEELGGYPNGSIVVKYVKCGKEGCRRCPHGPYYYLVWKEGGKTKWKYLGKEVPKEFRNVKRAKEISRRLREIEKEKRELLQLDLKSGGRE